MITLDVKKKQYYDKDSYDNTLMFEIDEVTEDIAREALRLASHKLPIATKFIKKEDGGELNEG